MNNLTVEAPSGLADLWSSCSHYDQSVSRTINLTSHGNVSLSRWGSIFCSGAHQYTVDEAYAGPQTVNISLVGTTTSG